MAAANLIMELSGADDFSALVITPTLRAKMESVAHLLLNLPDDADAASEDREPEADNDSADEASLQPMPSPSLRPVKVIRPSRAQMRAAYRRNGDLIPANLRSPVGRLFS